MTEIGKTANFDTEWQNRKLCNDGNCIGVIGKDGFCSECGKTLAGNGDEASREFETLEFAPEEGIGGDDGNASRSSSDMDWENRILCGDESCIGIIGPDGLCTECGKPAVAIKP